MHSSGYLLEPSVHCIGKTNRAEVPSEGIRSGEPEWTHRKHTYRIGRLYRAECPRSTRWGDCWHAGSSAGLDGPGGKSLFPIWHAKLNASSGSKS